MSNNSCSASWQKLVNISNFVSVVELMGGIPATSTPECSDLKIIFTKRLCNNLKFSYLYVYT